MYLCIALLSLLFCSTSVFSVLELEDDTFDLNAPQTHLLKFYAPWCGHCKRLAPEFAKASTELEKNDPPVILAKIDCTDKGKALCEKYKVSGYPTLKIMKDGVLTDYNGPRDADGIVKYMKSQVGPASHNLETAEQFHKFLTKSDVVVVSFVKTDKFFESHIKVADALRDKVTFGHTRSEKLVGKYGDDAIVLFRPKHLKNKFEPYFVTFKSTRKGEILEFINKNYHGMVGHRTTSNAADFKHPHVFVYYDVDYAKNPKGTNYWRNRVMKVAKKHHDTLTFAVCQHNDFQHEMEEFGASAILPEGKPLVLARDEQGHKFVMNGTFSVESFAEFVENLKNKRLEAYIKSEEVPEPAKEGEVQVLVAKNFEHVIDGKQDALIEFYAPWCGHCKQLAPIYDQLAKKMKDEDVIIAKMDATANDVPPAYKVQGFPTLYFVPKGEKQKPKSYDGERKLEDFIKYLAKHSTDGLEGYTRAGKKKEAKTEL